MLKSRNFIERSLAAALSFFKDSIFADEHALKAGFLQLLDPRIKTLTFLFFILQTLLARDISVLLSFYALCLLLARVSRINIGVFLKRTWIFIPIFSFFIAIPALFSIFTPGEALAVIKIAWLKLVVTRQGLDSAALFVMRVTTCVSFAVLLSITTRHFQLLKVLRVFKVPQIFVMTLGMCYRYIFLFLEIIENTYLAIKSRVGRVAQSKKGRHLVAWNIASLWNRSYHLNEEVYRAMLSRGYRGEPFIMDDFRLRARDRLWLCFVALIWITSFLN